MRASQTGCYECLTCVRVPRTGQDDLKEEQPISLHLLCHVTGRLPGHSTGSIITARACVLRVSCTSMFVAKKRVSSSRPVSLVCDIP